MEDLDRFILHHQVMEKISDEHVAVSMVDETKRRFPALRAVSMDKGFPSPGNQENLKSRLECVVLPKKGRPSQADKERVNEPEYIELHKQHSVVESAINALGVHGLDKCRDHGIPGLSCPAKTGPLQKNGLNPARLLQQPNSPGMVCLIKVKMRAILAFFTPIG